MNAACSSLIIKAAFTFLMIVAASLTLMTSRAYPLDERAPAHYSDTVSLTNYGSDADGLFSWGKDYEFGDDFLHYKSAAIDPLDGFMHSLKNAAAGPDLPPVINEAVVITKAYVTNFAMHELGHRIMADYAGATNTKFDLFKKDNGAFFLGQSTFDDIDEESKLPFSMAGEAGADLTFEHALRNYRKDPTLYNESLMFFSGTDFLLYCIYAFYLSDGHPYFDPVAVSHETGLSEDTIFTVVLAKAVINAYRVYSGNDYVVPYFAVSRDTASLNFMIEF